MRKKKKRINLKRLLLSLILIGAIIYGLTIAITYITGYNLLNGKGITSTSSNVLASHYDVIKEDINLNYEGKRSRKSKWKRSGILLLLQQFLIIKKHI